MRYGIAIWNFPEEGATLLQQVDDFADLGFDAISFLPRQLLECDDAAARDLGSRLRDRGLIATAHGNFEMTRADVETLVARLGDRLRVLSFDPAMTADSRGHFYDGRRMARFLLEVEEATRERGVEFGVEDFPLDALAVDACGDELAPLLECPRYGVLIDVGHLNLRLRKTEYFGRLTPADYVRRVPRPILELHVHDNQGEIDQHAHMGFGNVDFSAVAAGLREIGFDGVSTIEIAPSFHHSTPAESKPMAKDSLEQWRAIWEGTS